MTLHPDAYGKRILRLCAVILALAILMAGYTYFYNQGEQLSRDRQDCARTISNEQSAVKDDMTIAKARLDQAFVAGILQTAADPTTRDAVRTQLDELQKDLDVKIKRVEKLPPSQRLVDKRCPG